MKSNALSQKEMAEKWMKYSEGKKRRNARYRKNKRLKKQQEQAEKNKEFLKMFKKLYE